MDESNIKDKNMIEEIINEITNLKKYSSELNNNTRGEKLENYISNLNKSINNLENSIDNVYEKNFKNNNLE